MSRRVRVAVIDSGVHAAHPHVNGVAEGFGINADGTIDPDFVDRLGHGTAVTAAIKEKAPGVEIIAVRVFDRSLSTTADVLARAIDAAIDRGASLLNLSLGTIRQEHRSLLETVVARADAAGVAILAAAPTSDLRWLPGDLPGVIAVSVDWTCPRAGYRHAVVDGRHIFSASGYPREIPGVPPERNLKGPSFAVANMTGFAARAAENQGPLSSAALAEILAGALSIPQ